MKYSTINLLLAFLVFNFCPSPAFSQDSRIRASLRRIIENWENDKY